MSHKSKACHIKFLGTCTGDSTPTFLLFFDNRRYLFNCGEGTQRFCIEHKVKLAKIHAIFLTRLKWEQIGGLPGAMLTLSDTGISSVDICGPKNTPNFFEATRYFIDRNKFTLKIKEFCDSQSDYSDDTIRVVPIVLDPTDPEVAMQTSGSLATKPTPMLDKLTNENISKQNESTATASNTTQAPRSSSHVSVSADKKTTTMMLTSAKTTQQSFNDLVQHRSQNAQTQAKKKGASKTRKKRKFSTLHPEDLTNPDGVQELAERQPKLPRTYKKAKRLPDTTPHNVTICYAIHTPMLRGSFQAKKAKALGITPGKDFGRLDRGESVLNDKGVLITPDQVKEADKPGPIAFVVHCPTESHMKLLMRHPVVDNYNNNDSVYCIVHITPSHIVEMPAYKQWSQKFSKGTQHIYVNKQWCNKRHVFCSSAEKQTMLHCLHPRVFPLPYSNINNTPPPACCPPNSSIADTGARYILCPLKQRGMNNKEVLITPNLKTIQSNMNKIPDVAKYRSSLDDNAPKQNVQVVFLGTGSSVPSKHRNVSSTLIITPEWSMLLDAGEGTYGQLYRKFGPSGIDDILYKLKFIFISHMHADHHLGTLRILKKREEIFMQRGQVVEHTFIMGPTALEFWLKEYVQCESLSYTFDNNNNFATEASCSRAAENDVLKNMGFTTVRTVDVIHCPDAFALVVAHKQGWKIVFSGDTRPSKRLVEAGKDATLVIHEATFEDDLQQEAIGKAHSTTYEAIFSAKQMNAKFLMMNHFSQRYPKIPSFNADYENFTSIAFDLMTIGFEDFPALPKLLPCLKQIFDSSEEDE